MIGWWAAMVMACTTGRTVPVGDDVYGPGAADTDRARVGQDSATPDTGEFSDEDTDAPPCAPGAAALRNRAQPYATIQDAIDASNDRDVVSICPGTWHGTLEVPAGMVLKILSVSGDPEDTVLSGGGTARVIAMGPGASLTLQSVTLTDGFTSGDGGAIHAAQAGALLVTNCTFTHNRAEGAGGAVFTDHVFSNAMWPLRFDASTFRDNHAGTHGGAIAAGSTSDQRLQITNSVLDDHTAGVDAGAVAFTSAGGDFLAYNTLFRHNEAPTAGAMRLSGAMTAGASTVSFFDNRSATGPSALAVKSPGGRATLGLVLARFQRNTSGTGAALGSDPAWGIGMEACDFGLDANDNVPTDIEGCDGAFDVVQSMALDPANNLFCE